jgi:hypothetical protein
MTGNSLVELLSLSNVNEGVAERAVKYGCALSVLEDSKDDGRASERTS